jgi:hypothetical protein
VIIISLYFSGLWRQAWCTALLRIIPRFRRNTSSSPIEEIKSLPAPEPAPISPMEKETKVAVQEIMASISGKEVNKPVFNLILIVKGKFHRST